MATQQATALPRLLGRTITLLEDLGGVQIERRGQVIGIVTALPGSRCGEEFLLDEDDGDCRFYDPAEVIITSIE
ncbi:hypothetical protein MWT09_006281 [Pseudomonas aeruginosa]|nr:hypothetical protein [Pseudomonas aeruginosa]